MGEAFISRRGGGKPLPPGSYGFLQVVTSNLAWVVPETAWYKIYCVGKSGRGGNGGRGSLCRKNNTDFRANGGGGSGGNSGGVAISSLFLTKGRVIDITVNDSVSSFGGILYSTAGANGITGNNADAVNFIPSARAYPSNAIGQAYGGNIANYTGKQGGYGGHGDDRMHNPGYFAEAGQTVDNNTGGSLADTSDGGAGGGGGADYIELGIYQGSANLSGGRGGKNESSTTLPIEGYAGTGASQAITTPPRFEGGGGGGGGGHFYASGISCDKTSQGGVGSPGGVIIEKGIG